MGIEKPLARNDYLSTMINLLQVSSLRHHDVFLSQIYVHHVILATFYINQQHFIHVFFELRVSKMSIKKTTSSKRVITI